MKTKQEIEQRAKEVAQVSQFRSDHVFDEWSVEYGYVQGYTEAQKDMEGFVKWT